MTLKTQRATVFQMPTVANPEALSTVPELRQELHRINALVLDANLKLHLANEAGMEMVKTLNTILLMYIREDGSDVAGYLHAYLEERPHLREKLEESLECAPSKQVH